jgi:hypothetical protein
VTISEDAASRIAKNPKYFGVILATPSNQKVSGLPGRFKGWGYGSRGQRASGIVHIERSTLAEIDLLIAIDGSSTD